MPKSSTRSSADEIRSAIATTIRNNFDYRNVRGLTENPTVTQNPTRQTTEPYIYVYSVGQVEIDSTKDDTPFQYHVAIEVTLRYNSYRGGQRQGEEIMNEVFSYVRGKNSSEYPDLSQYGFNVYNTTTGDTVEFTDRLRGANYYKVVTALYVTASWTGEEIQVQPIQEPDYSYYGFSYLPISNNIERYDAGNIAPATSYPSPNNGWTFDTVSYSLTPNAQGSYDPSTRFILSGTQATAKFSGLVIETPNTDPSGADSPTGNAIDAGNAGRWSIFFGSQTGQTQPGWFISPTATRFFCNFTVGDTSITIEDIVNTFVDNYTNAYNGGTVTTFGTIAKINNNTFVWAPDLGSVESATLIANSIANTSVISFDSDYTIETTSEPIALDSTINYKRDGGSASTTHIVTTETTFSSSITTTSVEWTIAGTMDPFTVYVPQMGDAWSNMNNMFIVEKDTEGGRLFDAVDIGDTVRFTFGAGSASFPVTGKGGRSIIIGDAFDIVGTIGVTFSDGLLYTLEADIVIPAEIDTTLTATTSWSRIDSIRYGAIPASAGLQPTFPDDTSPTYGLRLLSNWNVEFGTTDPQNQSITITGDKDEYTYIVINNAFTLNGIRDTLGTNNINNFDVVTDGNYRYYISKTPILFDNSSFTYTLST